MIIYRFEGKSYNSLFQLKQAMPNVSFPTSPTDEVLIALGIEKMEVLPPEPTLEELKERKKSEIGAARYADATGHLKIGDHTYNIDKESQTALIGTMAAFQAGVLKTTNWKTAEGFVTLTAAEFMTVAATVLTYIDQCFAREKELLAAIGTAATEEELNRVTWEVSE